MLFKGLYEYDKRILNDLLWRASGYLLRGIQPVHWWLGRSSCTDPLKLLPVPDGTGGQGQALPLQGCAIKQ
jgi:hypothetical protein